MRLFAVLCVFATITSATFKIGTVVVPDGTVLERTQSAPLVPPLHVPPLRDPPLATAQSLQVAYAGPIPDISSYNELPPSPPILRTSLNQVVHQVESIITGYINVMRETEALEKELKWVSEQESTILKRFDEPSMNDDIFRKETLFLERLRGRKQVISSILDQNLVTMSALIREARTLDIDLAEEVKEAMESGLATPESRIGSPASSAWNSPRNEYAGGLTTKRSGDGMIHIYRAQGANVSLQVNDLLHSPLLETRMITVALNSPLKRVRSVLLLSTVRSEIILCHPSSALLTAGSDDLLLPHRVCPIYFLMPAAYTNQARSSTDIPLLSYHLCRDILL